ncbi:hypothetical protein HMPREF1553_01809 [Porphyromonas gingivalis F0568]|nr:hypothetical protein HMPREF1553_01809 [Porphyromonas gingivalis F0568]
MRLQNSFPPLFGKFRLNSRSTTSTPLVVFEASFFIIERRHVKMVMMSFFSTHRLFFIFVEHGFEFGTGF